MSKIGKQPIEIPEGVMVEVYGDQILVSGPKGNLKIMLRPEILVELADKVIYVKRKNDSKMAKSLHGLTRTLIHNAVLGVLKGWEKILEVVGTGFGARTQDGKLILNLGFSNPIELTAPSEVIISVLENKIKIEGADKAKVGEVAAQIRAKHPPNVYSGKGIRYLGEFVKTKPGKAAKTIGVK